MSLGRVLIATKDRLTREALGAYITELGLEADTAHNRDEALTKVRGGEYALIVAEPGRGFHDWVSEAAAPMLAVVPRNDLAAAVAAVKSGAVDCIESPVDFARAGKVIADALAQAALPASESAPADAGFLARVAHICNEALDVEDLMARLAGVMAQGLGADTLSFNLIRSDMGDISSWVVQKGEERACEVIRWRDESLAAALKDKDSPEIEDCIYKIPLRVRGRVMGQVQIASPDIPRKLSVGFQKAALAAASEAALALDRARLNEELQQLHRDSLMMLIAAIDAKDDGTLSHSERIVDYALAIARRFGLDLEQLRVLRFAALLHDIGKIGIRESILLKPGPLTAEEYEAVKRHPVIGGDILGAGGRFGGITLIMKCHHERMDGGGYPDGLGGPDIPLESRILSVADAFDAMISDRPYRRALEFDQALEELRLNAGSQFDSGVVEAALAVLPDLAARGPGNIN